jgi:tRNA (adenine37-N6)-methyltransferase
VLDNKEKYSMKPIGEIHSPFHQKGETPIQAVRSKTKGEVVLDPEYEEGLDGIEGFSHIWMVPQCLI